MQWIPQRDASGNFILGTSQDPFSKKTLPNGYKLFRRKYGIRMNCIKNSSTLFNFIVPYAQAKINQIEIVDGHAGDQLDFKVYDTPTGTISTVPNLMLNQFGFLVEIPNGFYRDESQYDADMIQDMKIEVTYKNNDLNNDKSVGINIVYHQLVAP